MRYKDLLPGDMIVSDNGYSYLFLQALNSEGRCMCLMHDTYNRSYYRDNPEVDSVKWVESFLREDDEIAGRTVILIKRTRSTRS